MQVCAIAIVPLNGKGGKIVKTNNNNKMHESDEVLKTTIKNFGDAKVPKYKASVT